MNDKTPRPKPERHTVIFILFVYRNLDPGLEFHHEMCCDQGFL